MYATLSGLVGASQIQPIGLTADNPARVQQGQLVEATDPYWGSGEFMYARASASIRAFGLCTLQPVFDSALGAFRFDMTETPNTAGLAKMVCVSMAALTVGQYGWFVMSGLTPVNSTASVAAAASFGITGAGQVGANSAGKQILNAQSILPATTTVVKQNCTAVPGMNTLNVPNSDGWFVGVYLSGTGIAAGTLVTAIDPTGRTVTLSAATTAAVAGAVTATYNNATIFYNIVHLNRPFAQGAIT